MEECIFCKIVKGEIPCYKIYEDKQFLAFLDIFPYVSGHTLVIPKKHYPLVWDVEEYEEYMLVVKKIVKKFQEVSGNRMVYQTIFGEEVAHAHIHILPIFDQKEMWHALGGLKRMGKIDENEAENWQKKLAL